MAKRKTLSPPSPILSQQPNHEERQEGFSYDDHHDYTNLAMILHQCSAVVYHPRTPDLVVPGQVCE